MVPSSSFFELNNTYQNSKPNVHEKKHTGGEIPKSPKVVQKRPPKLAWSWCSFGWLEDVMNSEKNHWLVTHATQKHPIILSHFFCFFPTFFPTRIQRNPKPLFLGGGLVGFEENCRFRNRAPSGLLRPDGAQLFEEWPRSWVNDPNTPGKFQLPELQTTSFF